jgi:hypothetical protein
MCCLGVSFAFNFKALGLQPWMEATSPLLSTMLAWLRFSERNFSDLVPPADIR